MVAFVGICQVHRAEILQLNGAWSEALGEAQRAGERCRGVNRLAAAAAYYQQAEVHRLRGELEAAEEAYGNASQWGWDPQPGLAQLRLAQGQTAAAAAAIRRALGEATAPAQRTGLLAAQVEILIATGEIEEARRACRELGEIACRFEARVLDAIAAQALGAVELAEGDAGAAVGRLRRAWQAGSSWTPPIRPRRYGSCSGPCRLLGDADGAGLEYRAARTAFAELGAAPDLARLEAPDRASGRGTGTG